MCNYRSEWGIYFFFGFLVFFLLICFVLCFCPFFLVLPFRICYHDMDSYILRIVFSNCTNKNFSAMQIVCRKWRDRKTQKIETAANWTQKTMLNYMIIFWPLNFICFFSYFIKIYRSCNAIDNFMFHLFGLVFSYPWLALEQNEYFPPSFLSHLHLSFSFALLPWTCK